MKKIIIFIFLATFFSISLVIPKKILALDCSSGISGQFLDAETKKPISGVLWNLTIVEDGRMYTGGGNEQGKFNYSVPFGPQLIGTLKFGWVKENYLTERVILSACLGNIIELKPIVSHDKDMCNKPCTPQGTECASATDSCTYCGVYEENMFKTFYRCMLPPVEEKAAGENKVTQTKYEIPELAPQINKIVNYSMGIGGIVAFILIIIGGFQIIVSGGNPERVKAGKEMITSAIAGLLLIIFSVFILRLIGYDILRIPGFEK